MISWVLHREYADFRVSSDGEVQGVGLLIAQEPGSGRLVVLAPIRGGPADKAGVLPGDEVSVTVNLMTMLLPNCCHDFMKSDLDIHMARCE